MYLKLVFLTSVREKSNSGILYNSTALSAKEATITFYSNSVKLHLSSFPLLLLQWLVAQANHSYLCSLNKYQKELENQKLKEK